MLLLYEVSHPTYFLRLCEIGYIGRRKPPTASMSVATALSRSAFRAINTTDAPRAARVHIAVAAPMPLEAPVTSACVPSSFIESVGLAA